MADGADVGGGVQVRVLASMDATTALRRNPITVHMHVA
jgi:hypothetical protein